jgi:hypothetical protein
LIRRLGGLFFAALQAIAHPFPHARFLTRKQGWEQSAWIRYEPYAIAAAQSSAYRGRRYARLREINH